MKSLSQFFEKSSESAIKSIELLQKQRQKKDKTAEKSQMRKAFERVLLQKSLKSERVIVNLFFTTVEKFFEFFLNSFKQFLNTAKQHNINDDLCFNQFSNHSFLKFISAKEVIYHKLIGPKFRKIMESNQQVIPSVGLSFEVFVQIAELINVCVFQTKRDLDARNR